VKIGGIILRRKAPDPGELDAQRKKHAEALERAERVLADFREQDKIASSRQSGQPRVDSKA
jgi:hypothetical protein